MTENLFDCDLESFECPPPARDDLFGVISWWKSGLWCISKEFDTRAWARREAERRRDAGHSHISIVRIPGITK